MQPDDIFVVGLFDDVPFGISNVVMSFIFNFGLTLPDIVNKSVSLPVLHFWVIFSGIPKYALE